jgi:GAF domain-containing protein
MSGAAGDVRIPGSGGERAVDRTVEFALGAEAEAVPHARAFVTSALNGSAPGLVDNAHLVVTELVTNALLHGAPPAMLRLVPEGDGIRVEVDDAGRSLPVQLARRNDAMTGRGLELVAAVSTRWGVEPNSTGGKTVWAHVTADSADTSAAETEVDVDVDALLAAWDDEESEQRYAVRVGAVPVDLLLAAKSHIDNVVRELTLMRAEEATSGVSLAPAMSALVASVTEDFAEARNEIKRQAVAAAATGEDAVDLVLSLPLSAADAGERYLEALDHADRHARAARLLTLAPPRSHRVFRQWYVHAVIDQLRAYARGDVPRPPEPFSEVLATEVERLSNLEDSWDRLQLLQKISADLTAATTSDAITRTVVEHAASYPGVATARVYVLTEERTFRSIAWHGGDSTQSGYGEFSIDDDLPGAIAARTGQPVFIRTLDQVYSRFPELEGTYPSERSLHIVPLIVRGHTLGLLTLTFYGGEIADETQVGFVQAIADVLAQAMERVQASERAELERGRDLKLLGAQLDVLTEIVAGRPLGDALSTLLEAVEAVSSDGMLASVLLLDEDGTHLRHCAAPSLPGFYNDAIDGIAIGPEVGSCGTAAFLRQQVIVEDVRTDPKWSPFRELADAAHLRACWSTPIIGQDGELLGTYAMYYPQPQRPTAADLTLIAVIVRTVTMAIERSRADEERERELAIERSAALTLQHSLLPAVPPTAGPLRLEARYRTGDPGVEVGGDWFDAIEVEDGTLLVVGDVQGHDLQAAALMGQLRTVTRTCAHDGQSPAQILAALHHFLVRIDNDLMTTAVLVHIDESGRRAVIASAGHLPPFLLSPSDGDQAWQARELDFEVGAPLGLGDSWHENVVELPPSSVVLLYTDGLVENRTWPLDHGLSLLHKTLESLPRDVDLPTALDAVLSLVPSGSRGDDVAVLAAALPD